MPYLKDHITVDIKMSFKYPQSSSVWREPPASSRQFSADEVGLLND